MSRISGFKKPNQVSYRKTLSQSVTRQGKLADIITNRFWRHTQGNLRDLLYSSAKTLIEDVIKYRMKTTKFKRRQRPSLTIFKDIYETYNKITAIRRR